MDKEYLRRWFDPQSRDFKELRELQHEATLMIDLRDGFHELRTVAGMDCSYFGDRIICAVVVLDYRTLEVTRREHVVQRVRLPYIPTYLTFREGCAMASAFEKLERKPDVLILDSCGINHPRRSGMASYFGAVMDHPTIGVSKKILCGEGLVPTKVGEYHELVYEEEQVGWVLKTSKRSNPIIVSPGHKVSMQSCLEIVGHCLKGHKLPEPTRLAHLYAAELREELKAGKGHQTTFNEKY
ncbi:MAG: deoxyribonuclease [Methanolobus sp.]|nr:deoxyribonuclease [Methanolobus sp.]MDN5309146.1 deoxyribonuclease [Methanolobus sp.]